MKAFKVSGSFPMGRIVQTFSLEVAANDEAAAREKTVSNIGSKHNVKRRFISITGVETLKAEDIESHVVKHLVGGPK